MLATAPGQIYTFAVVLVGWVFFRAASFHDAAQILRSWTHFGPISYGTFKIAGLASFEIILLVAHIAVLIAVDGIVVRNPHVLRALREIPYLAVAGALVLFYDIVLFGVFGSIDFIYFQF